MTDRQEVINTRIWDEEPGDATPFEAQRCFCHGFDLFGELVGRVSWVEYLLLLFKGEPPLSGEVQALETFAVAVANGGPRDLGVRAAMNGGVGGSQAAASLMAALAVGAGQYGGAREVYNAMLMWAGCGRDLGVWQTQMAAIRAGEYDWVPDTWTPMEHIPGFDPHPLVAEGVVADVAERACASLTEGSLPWLIAHREEMEAAAGARLGWGGVAAALFMDLGLDADQGEMLYLLLRLPGAAVHALEQRGYGWRRYPFFSDGLDYREGTAASPAQCGNDEHE